MRGASCWLVVDLKSFECLVEEVGGKLRGIILERSCGFSSRIKFEFLVGRSGSCCRKEEVERFVKIWEEMRREFRLEVHANQAGALFLT